MGSDMTDPGAAFDARKVAEQLAHATGSWPCNAYIDEIEQAIQAAYAAGMQAGLERAEKECDDHEQKWWKKWKAGGDPCAQGASDGAGELATRIRDIIEQEPYGETE